MQVQKVISIGDNPEPRALPGVLSGNRNNPRKDGFRSLKDMAQ